MLRSLSHMVDKGQFPHAILFSGQQGSGKHTLAVIFAAMVFSQGLPQNERARIAHLIEKDMHPDLITIQKGEKSLITVDAVRKIGEGLYDTPNEGSKKIYMIKNAGDMNEQAQNALLKMIEQPPAHTLFLLTCNSPGDLLPTVFSRVCHFSLVPPTASQAIEHLKNQGYPEQALTFSAAVFDGNIKKMVEYCDGENQECFDLALACVGHLCENHPASLLAQLAKAKTRQQLAEVIEQIQNVIAVCARQPSLWPNIKINRLNVKKISAVLATAQDGLAVNSNVNLTITWLAAALSDTRTSKN